MEKQLFEQEIERLLAKEQVKKEEPMSRHTTFRVGGPAEYYVTPAIAQIPQIVILCKEYEIPLTIIGNGSNLLVADNGLRGVVLEIGKAASGIKLVDGEDLVVQAGTLLSETANFAAKNGLAGMEFAAGIPGTIGGAVMMNAGAYGGEMKDILSGVRVLTLDGEVRVRPAEELELSYRHSRMMEEQEIVLEARINLTQDSSAAIRVRMDELRQKRVEKQPLEYPSAGSTFKRPEGHFAGKLIEDAGLRGFRVGDAQVSEKHCGFVINRGNATAAQIIELMQRVQERVLEMSGVVLEPEVRLLGF
ncbi:MAG: UDP-N-acetylmuramate dehydrogenase [Eubacterium sp.]|nr:UDP-N-acetylmuramate dehydrogenase [Eubacterium sp.]